MKLSEYVTQVINDPKYGRDLEWVRLNLHREHLERIEAAHDAEVRAKAVTDCVDEVRMIPCWAPKGDRDGGEFDLDGDSHRRFVLERLAEVRAGVVAEEPEGPTSMKPFHREYPGLPRLFHTYCSEHPDFGTCEEEVQAHRDIADHLASEHYDVNQEGAETDA